MIVADASVIVEILCRTPVGDVAERRLFERSQTVCAPHLLDVETIQVLRRMNRIGRLDEERARLALTSLPQLHIRRFPHDILLERVWALRFNLTAYDAMYVALAEALRAPLLTRDRRLAGSAGHTVTIETI